MVKMSIAPKGQDFAQFKQPVHFLLSILILNRLKRSVSDAKAPNGHRMLHWVLRLVRIGSTTTSARNKPMNITPAIRLGIEFIGKNSVVSLKGQNHSQ